MTFDPNPAPNIRRDMLTQKLAELRNQFYSLGIDVVVAEAQDPGGNSSADLVRGTVSDIKRRQQNASKAAEAVAAQLAAVESAIASEPSA